MTPRKDRTLELLLERASVGQPLQNALAVYGDLVLQANRAFNLTGAKSAEELVAHLLDSLTVIPYVTEPYVDVGSGAGFPAIPVALATGMAVTLVEVTAKKARFLESVLERLGLAGQVLAERAEVAARRPELRERFATGTARALAGAATMAELVVPFIESGGSAVCQLGSPAPQESQALEDASLILGAQLEAKIPLAENRQIIILRKITPTSARYPRRTGVPGKRPLCR